MKYLIFIFLLASSSAFSAVEKVRGDPVTATWVAPTEYTDGSPLPLNELSHFSLAWLCDTGKTGAINTIDNLLTRVSLNSNLMLGQCSITMTATDVSGAISDPSESVNVFIKLPSPTGGGFR
jgi:hypothetical protein